MQGDMHDCLYMHIYVSAWMYVGNVHEAIHVYMHVCRHTYMNM